MRSEEIDPKLYFICIITHCFMQLVYILGFDQIKLLNLIFRNELNSVIISDLCKNTWISQTENNYQ